MRSTILSALVGLLVLTGVAAAETKIAFVDMQRALLEVEDGKEAKARLEAMKNDRQGKLDARQEELKEMQKNLQAQKAFMKEDVLRAKEDEFRQKLGELQMTYATLQKELAQEEAELTKHIFARMSRILASMGSEVGYAMIFEKTESSLLWAQQHLDLTNELIRRYNDGEGKGGEKAGDGAKKKPSFKKGEAKKDQGEAGEKKKFFKKKSE